MMFQLTRGLILQPLSSIHLLIRKNPSKSATPVIFLWKQNSIGNVSGRKNNEIFKRGLI